MVRLPTRKGLGYLAGASLGEAEFIELAVAERRKRIIGCRNFAYEPTGNTLFQTRTNSNDLCDRLLVASKSHIYFLPKNTGFSKQSGKIGL